MHFCCAEPLCLLHKPPELLSRLSAGLLLTPSLLTFFPGESSSDKAELLCLPQGDCRFGWVYAKKDGKSKGGKVCSLGDAGEELEVFVLCWGGALLWKVLTPFKVYTFSIYLYIIHTARLKKSGSDYPLCKPFLKNTICYVKSKKKNWWQQLWNRICVAINYLD